LGGGVLIELFGWEAIFVHALTTTMAISAAVVAAGAVPALALLGHGPRASPPLAAQDA
jgi:sugar/nucleoside kinase (ribokinase family)